MIEVAWPVTGLDQELEASNDLAAESWTKVNDQISFIENRYRVTMPFDGTRRFYRVRQIIPPTSEIAESSPPDGGGGVAVTRETVIQFNTPLSNSTFITDDSVYAEFGGEKLAVRTQLSPDRRTITLFYEESLPSGARVSVTINGDLLEDIAGRKIDADSDGTPGGIGTLSFNTLSLATIPGTAVVGQVLASELGMENGEPVDTPLQGVTITLDGKEDTINAVTDPEGNFKLEPVPGGEFFVHIDGRTAINSQFPDGAYYPFVGKSWTSIPGRDDTLAGGTGVVHLPLIQAESLQPISNTEDTEITFMDEIVQQFPELAGVSITVPANSLFSDDGSRGGSVGIAPVPPDRLPGELPEMLRFAVVITVQTDGASNFDVPAPVRFPNLPDPITGEILPPGAKTALWSFNHDSGRWEIQGPMTISADGLYAVSDPGVGIRSPGWVGTNPGSPDDEDDPKKPDDDDDDDNDPDRPDREDDDDCTMEVICTEIVDAPSYASCLLRCAGSIFDRFFGDEDDKSTRSPLELGLCVGNVQGCSQSNSMDDALNSGKYDNSLSSNQTGCMDECLTPTSEQYPMIVPCEGFVDPCPQQSSFSPEEIKFLRENQVFYEVFDLETDIPRDWIAEQKALWAAESDYFNLVFGTEKISQTDPLELPLLREFFDAFKERTEEASESGKALSSSERNEILALQRLSQFEGAEWIALVDRMELMASDSLPVEQWDEATIEAAAQHVHDVTQLLLDRGWQRRGDGMIYGLERLSIHLAPEVGSEAFPARDHFYLIHSFDTGFDRRERLSPNGTLDGEIFGPNQYHMIVYVDPVTLNVGAATFFSSSAGQFTTVPTAPLMPIIGTDSDNDGLNDSIEKIIGTSASNPDTDADGISDRAEILNGTNPLDGIPVSIGIIGAIESDTKIVDITAINNLVAIASSTEGVNLYDVSNPTIPINIARIRLEGEANSISSTTDRLAIGTTHGIVVVNTANPTDPQIEFTTEIEVISNVLLVGRFIYAFPEFGANLFLYDAYTGELLDQRSTGSLDDISFADGMLYSLTSTLRSSGQHLVEKRPIGATLDDSLYDLIIPGADHPTFGTTYITAGGGYLYLGALDKSNSEQIPGVSIVEDTGTQFNFVGPPSAVVAFDVAIDGSGLLLFNGGNTSLLDDPSLGVLDVSDPTVTDNLGSIFDTDGEVNAIVIHNGYAYLADGSGGLKVVNYTSTPTEVNELSVSMETDVPGSTIESGGWMRVSAIVDSSTRVRNVEFYIDGILVVSDGGFPFEQYTS